MLYLPSIVSTKANQHDTDLPDGAFGLELHVFLDGNDHVAFHKSALIPERQNIQMPHQKMTTQQRTMC